MLVLTRRGEVGQQGPLRATQLLRLSSKSIMITMAMVVVMVMFMLMIMKRSLHWKAKTPRRILSWRDEPSRKCCSKPSLVVNHHQSQAGQDSHNPGGSDASSKVGGPGAGGPGGNVPGGPDKTYMWTKWGALQYCMSRFTKQYIFSMSFVVFSFSILFEDSRPCPCLPISYWEFHIKTNHKYYNSPHFSPTPPFSVTCFGNFSSQSSLHSFIFSFPFTVTPSTSSLHSPKNSWYLKNIFIDKQTSKTLKFYQRRSFSSLSEDV